jgi:hypothetical protein
VSKQIVCAHACVNTHWRRQTIQCTCVCVHAGLASAVLFLIHPGSEPSPAALLLLEAPLAAGRRVLLAINGPSRVDGLLPGADVGATSPAADGGGVNGALSAMGRSTPFCIRANVWVFMWVCACVL